MNQKSQLVGTMRLIVVINLLFWTASYNVIGQTPVKFCDTKIDTLTINKSGFYIIDFSKYEDGFWKMLYSETSDKFEMVYSEFSIIGGKLNGTCRYYWPNGQPMLVRQYKNGELEGKSYSYNKLGSLMTLGSYKKSKRHGVIIKYDGNGSILCKAKYKSDELVKIIECIDESYCED